MEWSSSAGTLLATRGVVGLTWMHLSSVVLVNDTDRVQRIVRCWTRCICLFYSRLFAIAGEPITVGMVRKESVILTYEMAAFSVMSPKAS
jgi:hypothetical protein